MFFYQELRSTSGIPKQIKNGWIKKWSACPAQGHKIKYSIKITVEPFLIDENGIIIGRYLRGDNLKKKLKGLFKE